MNEEAALVAEGPSAARLVLLGAPGSGKGTQASRLAARVGIAHVGTGDLMRARVEVGDEVGRAARPYLERGDLAPDSLVTAALEPPLAAVAAHGPPGAATTPLRCATDASTLTSAASSPCSPITTTPACSSTSTATAPSARSPRASSPHRRHRSSPPVQVTQARRQRRVPGDARPLQRGCIAASA